VGELMEELRRADLVVGLTSFADYEVLTTTLLRSQMIPTLACCRTHEDPAAPLSLDSIAHATWESGRPATACRHCGGFARKAIEIASTRYDVKITRLVHEHGRDHKRLLYFQVRQEDRRGELLTTLLLCCLPPTVAGSPFPPGVPQGGQQLSAQGSRASQVQTAPLTRIARVGASEPNGTRPPPDTWWAAPPRPLRPRPRPSRRPGGQCARGTPLAQRPRPESRPTGRAPPGARHVPKHGNPRPTLPKSRPSPPRSGRSLDRCSARH
jgi:hypothetical protein